MTQQDAILTHLQRHGSITFAESLTLYDCARLAARIHDLRRDGHMIETKPMRTLRGKRVARYRLVRPQQAEMF